MGLDHWLSRGPLDNEREELVTWRKENWLHNWFYVHCDHGMNPEEQDPMPVCKADVETLRDTIKDILEYGKELMGDALTNIDYKVRDKDGYPIREGDGSGWKKRELTKKELELNEYCQAHLPTRSGCFFGSTEYDGWYFRALEQELAQLNEVLENWDSDQQYWYEYWW